MNWFKIITRKGRQSLARELLEKNLTADTITRLAANGMNSLLARIQNKEKLEAIAVSVARASTLVATLSETVKDGKIDDVETAKVRTCVCDLLDEAVTPAHIDALIDRVVENIL